MESIGADFLLNFILLFIFLVFAFLAGTLSYYRAFRINNVIVHAIEMFEGYNRLSVLEIDRVLSGFGYDEEAVNRFQAGACPQQRVSNNVFNAIGAETPVGERVDARNGYCIYVYNFDMAARRSQTPTDPHFSFGVLTFMHLRLPVLEFHITIPVYARTNRMYDFEAGRNPQCLVGQSPPGCNL